MRVSNLIAGLLCSCAVHSATIQLSEPFGICNIRDAIDSANSNANVSGCVRSGAATEPDTILMPVGAFSTPLLTNPPYDDEDLNVNGDLDITSAIIVQGISSARTTLAAPDSDRLFDVRNGGTLTLRDLTIYGGSVVASDTPFGGAIRKLNGGNLTLQRVLVRGGIAERGGGIHGTMQVGVMNLRDVTITDAFASVLGGGLALESGGASALTELVNVTISGNAAERAGGLNVSFAPLRMRSSTVAFNRSTTNVGAGMLYNGSAPAQTVQIVNSILTDNINSDGSSDDLRCSTGIQLELRSHSIIGTLQSCTFATTAATPAASTARLLPLFDYGGGIPVHALSSGSAASNAGFNDAGLGCVSNDARGVTRFAPCDIGAYEQFFDEMIDSTADLPDLNPGDGLCRAAGEVCTLRAASMEANALGGRWFVGLPAGNYVLSRPIGGNDDTGGDLDFRPVSENTPPLAFTLFGLGTPGNTHIVGGGADRVVEVRGRFERDISGQFKNRRLQFALINATVRNGRQAFDGHQLEPFFERTGGGGISQMGGHSMFYNVVVRDNQLRAITDPNSNYAQGAGINIDLSRNDADNYRYASSARFERFAIVDNLGFGDPPLNNIVLGGGAYVYGSDAAHTDGAVFVNGTIAGNQSDTGAGMYIQGKTHSSFLTIHDNFVAADTLSQPAPGVYASNDGVSSFLNTIIAGNRFGTLARDCDAPMNSINSLGRVLIGNDTGCGVIGDTTSNLLNVDPLLGPRQTAVDGQVFYRLTQGSPAINFVPFNRCADSRGLGLRSDVLGAARPALDAAQCDLGAVEGAALSDTIFANGME